MRTVVFTMARNESRYLPVWVKYYSKHFENILVLDHGTDDGSIEAARSLANIRTRRLDHPVFNDFVWYTRTIQETQVELLQEYDVVVFCEPDEILWHPQGLGQFCDSMGQQCVRAVGYNIVQMPHEPKLDWDRTILSQRAYWTAEDIYNKPLISRIPLDWCWGFHSCSQACPVDKNLLLFHLHHVDRSYTEARGIEKSKWNWSQTAIEKQAGTYVLTEKSRKARLVGYIHNATLMPKYLTSITDF